MRKLLLLITIMLSSVSTQAQNGDLLEYQQEIGGGIGLSSYVGDASDSWLSDPGLMLTAIWRRNFNPRMGMKANLAFGRLSGTTEGLYFPQDPMSQTAAGGAAAETFSFSRNVVDLGMQFELNFLGYGLGAAYKELYRCTPYILMGAGITLAFGDGASTAGAFNIPVGFGVRYKLKPRVNLGLEWSIRFTTSDRLDDCQAAKKLDAPYGISGDVFKNKDSYSFLTLSLTYDISPKYRKCNN
ncbi:MAG: outer membrane beta-barrel protein [Bacteroidaceae bacterium]|nr:outer membrane beta-barrel protein [Bacteroidaceae bacterium]